jgi:SAM-dependent methyltransferase
LEPRSHANWESAAGKWQHRPPITPDAGDIAWFERTTRALGPAPRALLLGVTAGIATMHWPSRTELTAIDWSAGMIDKAWPRDGLPEHAAVVLGDWMAMPLPGHSRDIALGDGCYTALGSLEAVVALNRAVDRVLRPDGVLALRCFARGATRASVDEIFDELLAGREKNLGLVRWRLMMALQGDDATGVVLDDLWQVWRERIPDPAPLIEQHGWFAHEVANIERYAGQQARYVYPTVEEMQAAAAPYFDLCECDIPAYRGGEHFPRLRFMKRA